MRDLTAGMVTAVQKTVLHPIFFFEGEFGDAGGDFVRAWNGIGNISWDSKTWVGSGNLGGFSNIPENAEFKGEPMTVFLSGIPSALISTALGNARQGLPGKIWIGEIDPETMAITVDPFLAFEGKLDVPTIDDGGRTATIAISYESRAVEADKTGEHRYTPESQKHFFPGDLGFDFVAQTQEWNGIWGRR